MGCWGLGLGPLRLEFQSLGPWSLGGLWTAGFKGQHVLAGIRLKRFQSKESRAKGARVLGHLRSVSGTEKPRPWVRDNPSVVQTCALNLEGQWHFGVLDPVLLKHLGGHSGVRGVHCHEHPIFWELSSQPLEDWGSVGTKKPDSRIFWGLKSKSKRAI